MKRRTFLKGMATAVASTALSPLTTLAITSPVVPISIFHTNDTHAHLLPFKRRKKNKMVGGIANLASLVKNMRKKYPNSFLLSTGDVFQEIPSLSRIAKRLQGDPFGGFLQVSGCKVIYENSSLKSLTICDEPVIANRSYTVAMSDFMASGGNGFTMFKDVPQFMDGSKINDIIIEFVRNNSPLNHKEEGRIVII